MATNNATNDGTRTAHGVFIAEGNAVNNYIVLTAGQVLVGTTASDPVAATITGTAGITVAATSGAIALTGSGVGLIWNDATTSATMVVNNAYVADSASLVTLTLPATAALGSVFVVVGKGTGLWKVGQAASQQIFFSTASTTSGTGGSLTATNAHDCVSIVCTTANTAFTVFNSVGANITVT